MDVWESRIDTSDATFRDNARVMERLVSDLADRTERARAGGDGVARQRQLGKLLARERLELLLDPGTPFLELGALAANGLYDEQAPAAGISRAVIARTRLVSATSVFSAPCWRSFVRICW